MVYIYTILINYIKSQILNVFTWIHLRYITGSETSVKCFFNKKKFHFFKIKIKGGIKSVIIVFFKKNKIFKFAKRKKEYLYNVVFCFVTLELVTEVKKIYTYGLKIHV